MMKNFWLDNEDLFSDTQQTFLIQEQFFLITWLTFKNIWFLKKLCEHLEVREQILEYFYIWKEATI